MLPVTEYNIVNKPLRAELTDLSPISADFPDSATVGPGISFSVSSSDANPSGVEYQLYVDDQIVAVWDSRGSFHFMDLSDPELAASIDLGEVVPVDASLLTAGSHVLKVEARDFGGAVSDPRLRYIEVVDTLKPEIVDVTSSYGSADYYPDGSTFYLPNTLTTININASAEVYYGSIQAYRYRLVAESDVDAEWSDWGSGSIEILDLGAGDYELHAQCRDFTGTISVVPADTSLPDSIEVPDYFVTPVSVVIPDFTQNTILIVDESKDNSADPPGAPSDERVDLFYEGAVAGLVEQGWVVSSIDFNAHGKFVSPNDLYNQKIVIWHADDKAEFFLDEASVVLSEYLDAGGNLIVSGWNVLGAFVTETEATFSSGFIYKYLRVESGIMWEERTFIGITGNTDLGYEDMDINLSDEVKPGRWDGYPECWMFTPRHRTDIIGRWKDYEVDSENSGQGCVVRNFSPVNAWKTILLGFPLFVMQEDQAKVFIETAVEQMTEE